MKEATGSILIVDDNELNRDMLSRRLTRQGYEVTTAQDGGEALALIETRCFDLALFDIMMPGVSGLEALAAVRRTYSLADLPIIMVTAKSESDDIVEALKLGANDYVTKPIDFPVLIARVETHLRLRRLSELKNEFLRMASHDLKNPLTEIMGVASLLEAMVPPGTPMPQPIYNLVVGMQKGSRRMQHIIEDFLEFQAAEDGAVRLELVPLDLAGVVDEIIAANQTYAAQKGTKLTFTPSSVPPVTGDPRRLAQVVQNFVDNALKFTPPGGEVTVTLTVEADDVELAVRDSGPGLQDADFERVFRRYARLSNRPTGGESSSGLGLAIAKHLVERHDGGQIGVHNHPDGGAIFWFRLPASAPIAQADRATE